MKFQDYVAKAKKELASKSLDDIQVETALNWAARACAAKSLGLHDDAREYAHEALEHAALANDEEVIDFVRKALRMNWL